MKKYLENEFCIFNNIIDTLTDDNKIHFFIGCRDEVISIYSYLLKVTFFEAFCLLSDIYFDLKRKECK